LEGGMTSAYRRDHIHSVRNDEFERLGEVSRARIVAMVGELEALYPAGPAVSSGERKALQRAAARFLIDSGKAQAAGEV